MTLRISNPTSYHVDIEAAKICQYAIIFPRIIYEKIGFDVFDPIYKFVTYVLYDSMMLEMHFTDQQKGAHSLVTRQSSYVFKGSVGHFMKTKGIDIYNYQGMFPVDCRMGRKAPILCIDLSRRITEVQYSFSYTETNGPVRREIRDLPDSKLPMHKHSI